MSIAATILNAILWILLVDSWPEYRDVFFYRWILGTAFAANFYCFACEGKNILSKFTQFRKPFTRRR